MLSSSPPGNPQDESRWKRHYTSTHSTTQHYLQSLSRHRSVNLSHSTVSVRSTLKALTGSLLAGLTSPSQHNSFLPPPHTTDTTRLRVQSLPTTLHCTALTYHHITASASLSTTVWFRTTSTGWQVQVTFTTNRFSFRYNTASLYQESHRNKSWIPLFFIYADILILKIQGGVT